MKRLPVGIHKNTDQTVDRQKGFTLVELVLVIVILGVVSISLSGITKSGIDLFVSQKDREAMLRSASYSVERMVREISNAVPNSMRVNGNATVHCLEFVPIDWSTYYLELPLLPSTDDTLTIVKTFDIDENIFVPTNNLHYAVIYPTQAAHVFNQNLNRRQEVTACTDEDDNDCATDARTDPMAELTVGGAFAQSSPSRRLYLSSQSVSFCLRNQQLYRHVDSINQNQTLYTSGGTLMAKGVVNSLSSNPLISPGSEDPFQVFAADLRRNSFVQMRLTFSENDEALSFSQEVHIANTP